TSATATSLTSVNLIFSESLDETSAETTTNYSIQPELNISAANLSGNRVTLTTAEQTPGQLYTVSVNNVEDLAGNVIAGNNTANFTGYQGVVYDLIADIQADPQSYEGQTVTIHGIVTIGVNVIQTGNTNAYVQDNSGRGINIYNYTTINDLVRGNEVVITGTVTEYESSSGNSTTEITNPQVTVLSTGNPQPTPLDLDLADTDMLELEGTLLRVRGVIYEVYSAGGGDNLNIRDTAGNTITVRVWDTTGIDTFEFTVGFNLEALGVGSEYSNKLQLVPGYQDQLGEVQDLDDNVTMDPEQPAAGEAVTVTYNSLDETSSALIFWKTGGDHLFETDWMDSLSAYSFQYVIPAQPEGTTVYFYLLINELEASFTIPEEAPADLMSYTVAVTSHQAILNLPPHPFDPYAGEKFPIEYACLPGDKAILRIYNAEGKLVFTARNEIVSSGSGVQTFLWDGRDDANKLLPLGLYICHLEVVATATGKTRSKTAPIVIGAPLK
ncbi:MAG: hypothetical protein JW784_03440, partial [Candidatus Cloacimonetes bacterium]|nr:hypothetical protein [Candidatus Cloacimonadota bacterium]